ncbi:PEPxxWA-CTERM sorting domain-containing protein [Sphingomonas sp. RS2018]
MAGIVAGLMLSGSANAAVITKRYEITATYSSGPISKVVSSFDVTFDPSLNADQAVTFANYTTTQSSVFGAALATFRYTPARDDRYLGSPEMRILSIYGAANGEYIQPPTNDFRHVMAVDASGNFVSDHRANGSYYVAGSTEGFGSSFSARDITPAPTASDPTAAVPEPATWAMMLFGFGGIGVAVRRRPKLTTQVRFA